MQVPSTHDVSLKRGITYVIKPVLGERGTREADLAGHAVVYLLFCVILFIYYSVKKAAGSYNIQREGWNEQWRSDHARHGVTGVPANRANVMGKGLRDRGSCEARHGQILGPIRSPSRHSNLCFRYIHESTSHQHCRTHRNPPRQSHDRKKNATEADRFSKSNRTRAMPKFGWNAACTHFTWQCHACSVTNEIEGDPTRRGDDGYWYIGGPFYPCEECGTHRSYLSKPNLNLYDLRDARAAGAWFCNDCLSINPSEQGRCTNSHCGSAQPAGALAGVTLPASRGLPGAGRLERTLRELADRNNRENNRSAAQGLPVSAPPQDYGAAYPEPAAATAHGNHPEAQGYHAASPAQAGGHYGQEYAQPQGQGYYGQGYAQPQGQSYYAAGPAQQYGYADAEAMPANDGRVTYSLDEIVEQNYQHMQQYPQADDGAEYGEAPEGAQMAWDARSGRWVYR